MHMATTEKPLPYCPPPMSLIPVPSPSAQENSLGQRAHAREAVLDSRAAREMLRLWPDREEKVPLGTTIGPVPPIGLRASHWH